MRANLPRLGQLAADETGNEAWAEEQYVYGPLALGITSAAVNEATEHCEDLFALLNFLREPLSFPRQMGSYSAGRVVRIADQLAKDSDAEMASRFCVPSITAIESGMVKAKDPPAALEVAQAGIARLGELVREVVDFYKAYEFFHVQYKHGLKILFRPFGGASASRDHRRAEDECQCSIVCAQQRGTFQDGPAPTQPAGLDDRSHAQRRNHISPSSSPTATCCGSKWPGLRLISTGLLAHSWTVSRLLRLAATNRLSLGHLDQNGQQIFELPGEGVQENLRVVIEPNNAIEISDHPLGHLPDAPNDESGGQRAGFVPTD